MSSISVPSKDISRAVGANKDPTKVDKKRKLNNEEELEDFNEESMPGDDEVDDEDGSNEAVDKNKSDVDNEDEDYENQDKEIQVDFEAFTPEEIDFQGIRKLLKQLFLKESVDISGLTQLIINQNTDFSIVMKQESEEDNKEEEKDNDEEVYAITSLVPLHGDSKSDPAIIGLKNYFLKKTEKSPEFNQMLKSSSKLYWLANERFINLSPKLSLPSFELIMKEISEANQTIDNIVMVIKILKEESKESNPKSGKKSKNDLDVIYQNPEEELMAENSDHSTEFSVASQCDEDARSGYWDDEDTKFIPYRKMILFTMNSFEKAIECLQKEFE